MLDREQLPDLKVAIVLVDFYRFDSVSTSVAEQAIVLSEAGLKVSIVCNNQSGIDAEFIVNRLSFNIGDYDVILYHYYVGDSLLDEILLSKTQKFVYFHGITNPPEVYAPYSPQFVEICKTGLASVGRLNEFDFLMSNSKCNIELVQSLSHEKSSIPSQVIPPVVSVSRFQRAHRQTEHSEIHLLTVGRIFSSKNLEGVIQFANCVGEIACRNVRLSIVGSKCEPTYVEALLSTCQRQSSLQLDLYLKAADERVGELYETADAFVSFSHHEGFCIPLIEAMAAHLLVVTHAQTAIGETMGPTGIVVAPYDYESAARSLVEALGSSEVLRSMVLTQHERFQVQYSEAVISAQLIGAISTRLGV